MTLYKKIVFVFALATCLLSNAQTVSFEGVIDYQVEIKSKIKGIGDETMRRLIGYGPSIKIYIKQGRYYRITSGTEEYVGIQPQLNFIKYKQRDTLYNVASTMDSTLVPVIKKQDKTQTIAGYICKSITIKTAKESNVYLYAPALMQDPLDNDNNKGTDFYTYVNETKSVYLKIITETESVLITQTATRVQPMKLDDKLFVLPGLPQKKFLIEEFIKTAEYKSEKEWIAHLQRTVNADLANKYIKIPKGQTSALQTAIIEFVVTETGVIGEARVVNANEVHSALAKEAVRVIKESFGWKPATFNGQKIDSWVKQTVTFMSTY
jgi:Gram-negative bacterial TonB protein C-terminal